MKILFENLESLIDAPNGIEKARELILQLAVQGKLVRQDPYDEPASELLKKIKKEKEKLIAEGKIRKQNDVEPITDEEKSFELPQGWCWVRNAELFFFERGNNPKDLNKIKGKHPYINIKAFEKGIIEQYSDDENVTFCNPKDILIVCDGSRSGLIGNGMHGILGSTLARIDPYLSSTSDYLKLFISSKFQFFNTNKKGAAIPHLDINLFKNMLLSLPPLNEQKRIVEKVNSLMALLDELEEKRERRNQKRIKLNSSSLDKLLTSKDDKELKTNWKRIEESFSTLYAVPENVEKLKQAILQLAVQGKLVKQDPKDEPASELLKKIKIEKEKLVAEGKIKKQNELPPIKDDEKPFELPKGWEWVRLQEVFDVRDGTHDTPKYVKEGIPLVTSRCFSNGEIDFTLAQNISRADHNEIQKRSYVEVQDILFSMIGGNLGNMIMVKTDKEFSIKNVALFKYYNKEFTLPNYLYLFLQFLANGIQKKSSWWSTTICCIKLLKKSFIPITFN